MDNSYSNMEGKKASDEGHQSHRSCLSQSMLSKAEPL